MSEETILRVMWDGAQGGAENMAVDEAILLGVNEGASPASLRFYRWSEPTISLGYFQRYAEFQAQEEDIRRLPLVRRQTGGGAILHDDEITYSLVMPIRDKDRSTDIADLYRLVHDAFIEVLGKRRVSVTYRGGQESGNSQRGPFFCFSREHRLDLVLEGEKLLGSAQRRMKHAVLQHGSLILRRRFEQQESAQLVEKVHKEFTLDKLIDDTSRQVAVKLGCELMRGDLNEFERTALKELKAKYESGDWNRQR